MNDLIKSMSVDMNIPRFYNESESSYIYRICYSALGLWCLCTSLNYTNSYSGTSKHNQTIVLNNLLEKYTTLFPSLKDYFIDTSSQQLTSPIILRRIYEETGYLLTDSDNRNQIAKYGRTVQIGNAFLYFGYPKRNFEINGLGVFTDSSDYIVNLKDFLIRDSLSVDDYFNVHFDMIDFYEKSIDLTALEYFNPKSNSIPSMSWTKNQETDFTIARMKELRTFYRVIKTNDGIQFADITLEQQSDSFTSYEYRRLYFALKAHYGKPLRATISLIDEVYSKIHLGGHLPNREYYLLLLSSWPELNAFDKVNFIIRNELLSGIIEALAGIGIDIKGGLPNV
jgi:hypothetical protein